MENFHNAISSNNPGDQLLSIYCRHIYTEYIYCITVVSLVLAYLVSTTTQDFSKSLVVLGS